MSTFGADGTKLSAKAELPEAAPAEDQLDVPAEFCEPDDDGINDAGGSDEIDPDVLASVSDISTDDADLEKPADQVALRDQRIKEAIAKIDAEDEVAEAVETEVAGTAVALADRLDVSTLDEGWEHDWLEFKGDKLGIRLPTKQALAAFSLASSKYVSLGVKNDLTGLFIARHLSPESYGRVFSRLMDPDDEDYSVETVGELFNAIVTASIEADK